MALLRFLYVRRQNLILDIGNTSTLILAFGLQLCMMAFASGHMVVIDLTIGGKLKDSLCHGISFELFEMVLNHKSGK